MKYHLVKLTSYNETATLTFDSHSALVAYLRNMFSNDPGASIVAIYIGL